MHGSVAVKTYTISKNGSITEGEALDSSKYEIEEPSDGNKNTLTVRLKTDDAVPYLIEFKTSLKGQVIKQSQYTNKAEYFNNDHADRTLTGSVSIANGGNLISKGGKQNGNDIDWSINVNASQSTLDDVKVKDTPDENQIIDEDSFKVYQAKYNENGVMKDSAGNFIPGDVKLEKDKDYKLDIKLTMPPANNHLSLPLQAAINKSTARMSYNIVLSLIFPAQLVRSATKCRYQGQMLRSRPKRTTAQCLSPFQAAAAQDQERREA